MAHAAPPDDHTGLRLKVAAKVHGKKISMGSGKLEISNWDFKMNFEPVAICDRFSETIVMSNHISVITPVIRTTRGQKVILDSDLARI